VAFVVFQDVIGFKKETAARAAVADGIRSFLPVADGMNQTRFSRLLEDFLGLFPANLPAQVVFNNVVPEPAEVETDLHGMVADLGVGIEKFPLTAWTEGDRTVVLGIHELDHVFIWQNPARIFNGLVYGYGSKSFGVNLSELFH
jgi:hypothetical protein